MQDFDMPYVDQWRAEARLFRAQARDRWTNSTRQKVNLGKLYRDALCAMPDTIDGLPPLPVPTTCPITIDDLLADEPCELDLSCWPVWQPS